MKKRIAFLSAALGAAAGGVLVKRVWLAKYREQKEELAIANMEKDLLYTWLLLEQNGAGPGEYFAAHGYGTIGIMGMNREGRRLYEALRDREDVTAAYAVELDNFSAVHEHMTVYRLGDDPLPEADCVVICDITDISEKRERLRREFKGEIVTLTDVLAWLIEEHRLKSWDGAIRGWPAEGGAKKRST